MCSCTCSILYPRRWDSKDGLKELGPRNDHGFVALLLASLVVGLRQFGQVLVKFAIMHVEAHAD